MLLCYNKIATNGFHILGHCLDSVTLSVCSKIESREAGSRECLKYFRGANMIKWVCAKCGYEMTENPKEKYGKKSCPFCKGKNRNLASFKQCEFCNKWFKMGCLKRKFCSYSCKVKGTKCNRKKGKHYPHLQRAEVKKCLVCQKEFRAIKAYGNYSPKYCSKACWNIRSILNKALCLNCEKEFIKPYKRQKFCCNKCKVAYMVGDKASCYKDGKSLERNRARDGKQLKEWKVKVYEKDNYTCQSCGSNKELHAHHIKGYAEFPDLRFDINNGKTLCIDCHGELHGVQFHKNNKICIDCGKKVKILGTRCRQCSYVKQQKYKDFLPEWVILSNQGISGYEIGRRYNIDGGTINNYLRRYKRECYDKVTQKIP